MKIVLDTNVLVSGIFFSGSPYRILKAWQESKILVSGDKHLLKISGYEGIQVLKPREFIDKFFK